MRLGIEITSRCNARCAHCSAACGPQGTAALGTDELRAVMDQAAALNTGQLEFALTGGEPFLDLAQLRALIAHGRALGAIVGCVSNGFWATSVSRGVEVLAPLADAGLRLLGISSSRFHRAFVPAERVAHALQAARQCGLRTVLKQAVIEADLSSAPDADLSAAAAWADEVESFAVIGPGRSQGAVADHELIRPRGIPLGRCPSEDTMIAADGRVLACCSSGPVSELHTLGDIRTATLARALDRLHRDPVHQRLRAAGPASFLPAVVRAGHQARLREGYVDTCDLCTHLASDPQLASVVRDSAHETHPERSPRGA